MDFEEDMELFFVRKYDLEKCSKDYSKNVLSCVPLLLKHVKSRNENGQEVNKIFSDSLIFKSCLVYGKIIGKGNDYKTGYNYILDDGTASLPINIFRKTNDMEEVWRMYNELQAVKRNMLAQNQKELVDSLQNLIYKTKEQIDFSNISIGAKVLVYGKPAYYRGVTSLKVFRIIEDGNYNRDIEIHFKDYLIDWYKNMISTNT